MWKRALIYGAAIAIAGTVLTALVGAAGLQGDERVGQLVGLLGLVIPIVGIVLAIRAAKRAEAGEFSFGDGFKQGATVTVVAAVLGAVLSYLYLTALNPGYLDVLREATSEQLRQQAGEQGLSPREAAQMESMTSAMTSPGAIAGLSFISQLIMGLIVSAIAAAVMRRRAPASTGDGYGG